MCIREKGTLLPGRLSKDSGAPRVVFPTPRQLGCFHRPRRETESQSCLSQDPRQEAKPPPSAAIRKCMQLEVEGLPVDLRGTRGSPWRPPWSGRRSCLSRGTPRSWRRCQEGMGGRPRGVWGRVACGQAGWGWGGEGASRRKEARGRSPEGGTESRSPRAGSDLGVWNALDHAEWAGGVGGRGHRACELGLWERRSGGVLSTYFKGHLLS